jgi:DNA-binding beta-propeller fold protein YncE
VGNVPTTDCTISTISQGSLQVINRHGKLVQVLNDSVFLDSPWDLAINDNGDHAQVFVSNVLSGTVSRLDLAVGPSNVTALRKTEIAVGYAHQPNAAALVLGPTGLAYDGATDILYVASTADNAIFAVPKAGNAVSFVTKGTPIFAGPQLRGPLALVFAPNGNLLAANGDAVNSDPTRPSEIVEFTKSGEFVREFNVDASQGGAFGIATVLSASPLFNFAAVDDVPNIISVYFLP